MIWFLLSKGPVRVDWGRLSAAAGSSERAAVALPLAEGVGKDMNNPDDHCERDTVHDDCFSKHSTVHSENCRPVHLPFFQVPPISTTTELHRSH